MKTNLRFFPLLILSLMTFAPAPGFAKYAVPIHAAIIVASNEGSDYDLINDAYRDQLINLFSYTFYHQKDDVKIHLQKGKREKLDLPDGYELMLTLQDVEKDRLLIQALIRKNGQQYVYTVLSLLRPGVVFLGGPPAENGSLIIVLETSF